MIDFVPNTPPLVIPEVTGLLAQLEEANKRARQAEINVRLLDLRVSSLLEQIRLPRIAKFGPRGESLSAAQLALFEEELSATLDEVAAEAARGPLPEAPRKNRKKHPGRQTLPADLPRVVHVVPCGPAQCVCGNCAAEMVVIGYEESEKLDVEPTPVPAEIVEKGLVSSRVVINTVVAKYADYLPLYRQSAMLERDAGVLISRGTIV